MKEPRKTPEDADQTEGEGKNPSPKPHRSGKTLREAMAGAALAYLSLRDELDRMPDDNGTPPEEPKDGDPK